MIIRLTYNTMEIKDVDKSELIGKSIVLAEGLTEILDYDSDDIRIKLIDEYGKGGVLYVIVPERSTKTHLLADIVKELKIQNPERRGTVSTHEHLDILYVKEVGEKYEG